MIDCDYDDVHARESRARVMGGGVVPFGKPRDAGLRELAHAGARRRYF